MKRKVESVFKDLEIIKKGLLGSKYLTTEDLQNLIKPKPTTRTIQRRLDDLKKSENELYLLKHKTKGYRLIARNVDLELLERRREKKTIVKNPVLKTYIYENGMSNMIYQIFTAMDQKVNVKLKSYSGATGGGKKDYIVFPLKMVISETPFILAYDDEKKAVKQFIIGRTGSIELTTDKQNFNSKDLLAKIAIDTFGFSGEPGKLWEVEFFLTNFSKNMAIHDHNFMNDCISEIEKPKTEKINGKDYEFGYVMKVKVFSIVVIGRLVTGMLDHVKIKTASDDFKKALKTFVINTVVNSIDKNISLK